jgi:hypothetical protein
VGVSQSRPRTHDREIRGNSLAPAAMAGDTVTVSAAPSGWRILVDVVDRELGISGLFYWRITSGDLDDAAAHEPEHAFG